MTGLPAIDPTKATVPLSSREDCLTWLCRKINAAMAGCPSTAGGSNPR
jgi:hypothetical protein